MKIHYLDGISFYTNIRMCYAKKNVYFPFISNMKGYFSNHLSIEGIVRFKNIEKTFYFSVSFYQPVGQHHHGQQKHDRRRLHWLPLRWQWRFLYQYWLHIAWIICLFGCQNPIQRWSKSELIWKCQNFTCRECLNLDKNH